MRKNSPLLAIIAVLFLQSSVTAESVFQKPFKEYKLESGHKGGRLVIPATSDPKSFNPIVANETSTTQITSLIFEGLTRTHPLTLEVVPNLAKSWETEDGKVWIFYLREDVFFNDGEKFKADDVVFTFNELIYNSDIPTSSRDIFTIEGKKITVERVDDYTVKFTLPCVFAPFLRALSHEILPRHKYHKIAKDKKFTFSMGLDSKLKDIVGTGPYCLKQYLPGERVVFAPNPYYWKKDENQTQLPYLQEIIYIILQNSDTALLKFLDREIDYYSLRSQDLAILGPRCKKDLFTIYNAGPSFGSNFLVFNQNNLENPRTKKPYVSPYKLKWFGNIKFRKAIAHAINKDKIIKIVMNDLGVRQFSSVSPANKFFYTEDVKKHKFSPDKAKQLLAEIGFGDRDQDGTLEDSQGKKLELNFFTNADNTQRVQIATLVKKDLEDIGMKISFLPLDFNNLVSKLTATFDWELIMIGLTGGIEPYFGKNVWSYKGNLHMWNPTKKAIMPFEQEIEDIFNLGAKTIDESKRKELFFTWQKIVARELPLIYTAIPYSLYAIRDKFANLYPTVYGGAFGELEWIYIRGGKHE
ncbi:MAG: ABC transporter substrate-binding protein [Candidatus Omnitrophica bacterium]|nr:ABC transporter substrate-binding protein [Candidatus Omnitrophota bacterium]